MQVKIPAVCKDARLTEATVAVCEVARGRPCLAGTCNLEGHAIARRALRQLRAQLGGGGLRGLRRGGAALGARLGSGHAAAALVQRALHARQRLRALRQARLPAAHAAPALTPEPYPNPSVSDVRYSLSLTPLPANPAPAPLALMLEPRFRRATRSTSEPPACRPRTYPCAGAARHPSLTRPLCTTLILAASMPLPHASAACQACNSDLAEAPQALAARHDPSRTQPILSRPISIRHMSRPTKQQSGRKAGAPTQSRRARTSSSCSRRAAARRASAAAARSSSARASAAATSSRSAASSRPSLACAPPRA